MDAGLVPVLITEITGPDAKAEDKREDKERPATPTNATVHPVDPVIRMSPPQHLSGEEDGEDDLDSPPAADPYHELRQRLAEDAKVPRRLVIMRGLPGSGKTFLSKLIQGDSGVVCSADAYFQQEANGSGNYNFDASRIKEAHRHCKLQFEEALENKRELVIIDNTNVRAQDYSEYLTRGVECGYHCMVVGVRCESVEMAAMFAERCLHAVRRPRLV